jgi:RNA exonuclease NGL2
MIYCEILDQNADILCLQEVDRLEKLLPVLENAGFACHYESGPGKKHGCLVAFKKTRFTKIQTSIVQYDSEEVHTEGESIYRRGSSFKTKNIGLIVALKEELTGRRFVVATTHLFWHPRYLNYEFAC